VQDTTKEFRVSHLARLDALPEGERLLRALRMFDYGREIMRAGIRHDRPELSDVEVEQRLFLRMYGDELPAAMIERALARIASAVKTETGPDQGP
jgi:hypothetical protein